jgi:hypothetical protein
VRDPLIFEQLHKIFSNELKLVNEELESISGLFKNIPLNDATKRTFLEKSYKKKSAYYACLVNTNIDTLLFPEYLESKLSRNILIKKETEQYFKSIDNFQLHNIQSTASIYECILFSEDAEVNNSFDLFSNQAPESASSPDDLKLIFEQWAEDFKAYSPLETILYSVLDWHAYNKNSFSNKRQILLYLNYQFWKQYGTIFQKLEVESRLFHNWSLESLDPIKAAKSFITAIQEDIVSMKFELRELYNEQINFKRLNPKQKIVSNFIFSKFFKLNLEMDGGNTANNSIVKQIQKKGFVDFFELSQHVDFLQQKKVLSVLIDSNVLELSKIEGVVGLYLNTSFNNKKNYLYKFQNIKLNENYAKIDEFFNQSISNPIVAIEKLILTPEPILEVSAKSQKAFFG